MLWWKLVKLKSPFWRWLSGLLNFRPAHLES